MSKKRKPRSEREDFHHFLYQAKHWSQGYARLLRQHPFCGAYIPQFSLHSQIHSKIHDIPTPNGKDCRRVFQALDRSLNDGTLSLYMMPSERVEWLAEQFKNCPATYSVLMWQAEVLAKNGR